MAAALNIRAPGLTESGSWRSLWLALIKGRGAAGRTDLRPLPFSPPPVGRALGDEVLLAGGPSRYLVGLGSRATRAEVLIIAEPAPLRCYGAYVVDRQAGPGVRLELAFNSPYIKFNSPP
jgi:hypothetical protein